MRKTVINKSLKSNEIIIFLWSIFLIIVFILYFIFPQFFSVESIVGFIKNYSDYILPAYIFIFLLRSFTLIPNTPFVIAGTILFPDSPYLVLFISIGCIVLSSVIIYFFSELLGFDKLLKNKYPSKMENIQNKLNGSYGLLFIILWAFFPFAPTDLVCYGAGTLRINIYLFLSGVIIGELPICYFFIFSFKYLNT